MDDDDDDDDDDTDDTDDTDNLENVRDRTAKDMVVGASLKVCGVSLLVWSDER